MCRTILALVLALLIGSSFSAKAEMSAPPTGVASHIASVPGYAMDPYGRMPISPAILRTVQQQRLPPSLVFVLLADMVNSGVERALKEVPPPATPYLDATTAFERAVCYVRSAFWHAFAMTLLPYFGGRGGGSQAGMMLAQSMGGGENCANGQKNNSMDPGLLLMFMGKGGVGPAAALGGMTLR